MDRKLFVVDNFYDLPDNIREFALSLEYEGESAFYKGKRSKLSWYDDELHSRFEQIMNMKLKPFSTHGMCGRFQILTPQDPIVYHSDLQKWAAVIFLTPNAPIDGGTQLLKSKLTGARHPNDPNYHASFEGGFFDKTNFEVVDSIGNIYNRLVIFDAQSIHAASCYFGNQDTNARLTHLFFFDSE